jgi:hypothetical protein
MGVDLDDDVMLGACPKLFLDVDFIPWPPLELSTTAAAIRSIVSACSCFWDETAVSSKWLAPFN